MFRHAQIAAIFTAMTMLTGEADAAGVTFQRATFTAGAIPGTANQAKTLVTLKFVAGASGTAVFRARGFCNLSTDNAHNNAVDFEIRPSTDAAFSTVALSDWGVVAIPWQVPAAQYSVMWSAERTAAVTSGQTYSYVLAARHEYTTPSSSRCSGSLAVEIH